MRGMDAIIRGQGGMVKRSLYPDNPLGVPSKYDGVVWHIDITPACGCREVGTVLIPGDRMYMFAVEFVISVIRMETGAVVYWYWEYLSPLDKTRVSVAVRGDLDAVVSCCVEAFADFVVSPAVKRKI